MTEMTAFERAVLDALFEGDDPILVNLRMQARSAKVASREHTGAGFFVDFVLPEGTRRAELENPSVEFGDVVAQVDALELGMGFLVYVQDGLLSALEGYTFGESCGPDLELRSISYQSQPRDLSGLK